MKKYIVIDRDGVINYDSPAYIKSAAEWHAIPGSLEAIAQLNRAGYHVFIATNQSGIARGLYNLEVLNEIHEKLIRELSAVGGYVDEIFYCPHHPDECCECRKPKPGLLLKLKKKFNVDLFNIYFIGDSYSDIEAAIAVGCKPILVLTGNGEKTLQQHSEIQNVPYYRNLKEAVENILRE